MNESEEDNMHWEVTFL